MSLAAEECLLSVRAAAGLFVLEVRAAADLFVLEERAVAALMAAESLGFRLHNLARLVAVLLVVDLE
ncbi:hypothetical protein ACLKA6_003854 [Drosophila palustris]